MPKKIAVIDGNSLMHRAYHAVPQTMNAPDGRPTNAVFGFIAMLLKFIDIASPDALICAFDAGRPAFRMEALEQYKSQRPPMDDDLKVQFPIIEELLEAMNVPVVRIKGWEGDDVLGTIAARDEELGYETLLVTGDKDAYQLATDMTRIVTTKKGITDVAIYGPAEVLERYGVRPDQFIDFLGLKGDSSDNIPGVPGIGDKTAAKLLQTYGSLEGIYEHVDDLKGKQKEKIVDNKDMAFLSRDVATIVRDLDFPLDLEACSFPSFDSEKVTEAFKGVQFNAHLGRVLKLVGKELEKKAAPLAVEPVVSGSEAHALVDAAVARGETVGVAFIEPEQVSLFNAGLHCAVNTSEGTALFEDDEGREAFARIVRHAENLLVGREALEAMGAQFFHIDRGGDITFHGPGQLVCYPILDLERLGIGLRAYIDALEESVIRTVAEYGIRAGRIAGASGVWVGAGIAQEGDGRTADGGGKCTPAGAPRKICAIGVRSSRYITMHGFALNVTTDLEWFSRINPCGFTDRGATSIERETGAKVPMDDVKRLVVKFLSEILNVRIYK